MLTVRIEHDSDVENPLNYGEWKLHSFGRKHSNFIDPERVGLSLERDDWGQPKVVDPGLRSKLKAGTAFFCYYYEHGQCMWGLTGDPKPGVEFQWDGCRYAGLLIWTGKPKDLGKDYESRFKIAALVLEEYTDWCNGECYWYSIEDEHGEELESCGGYIGDEYMLEEIARTVGDKECRFEGDHAWLGQYMKVAV